ncbi:MAG: hypothetical protein ACFFDW_06325 [Candidatus Thorarchaeota archaeon]
MKNDIVDKLLEANDPAVRLKTLIQLFDFEYESKEVQGILVNLDNSSVIQNLLSSLRNNNQTDDVHVYKKWWGDHWSLSLLADMKYPSNKKEILPNIEREFNWLLSEDHWNKRPTIKNRKRFCASQEGNGLFAALSLSECDERCDFIADRLIKHQWPDGGWNCDRNPDTHNSSYHESLIPLRALNLYAQIKNNTNIKTLVEKSSELFLKRKLFRKMSDNSIIDERWLLLTYPPYWHYDIFTALKVLAEIEKINDKRCNEALEILESKRLLNGGFPKEYKYCQSKNPNRTYYSPVDWGGTNTKTMHEWITIDALYILKKAKRIDINY